MLVPVAAVLGGAVVTSKVLEAFRCRKVNAEQKYADIPQSTEEYSSEGEAVTQDETGAYVRAFERPDGVELYLREFQIHPGVTARGAAVLVHGFTVHSGVLQPFIDHLVKNGISVVTYDLRGHGRSGKVDGIPMYFTSFEENVQDFLAVLQWAEERHVGTPCFAYGESYGGLIVTSSLLRHPQHEAVQALQGVLLGGPALKVGEAVLPPPPVVAALKTLSRAFPKLMIPDNSLAATFELAFGDSDAAAEARHDPLNCFEPPRVRVLAQGLAATSQVHRLSSRFTKPLLIVHGTEDMRTPLDGSEDFVASAASEDKTLLTYDGAKHMLFYDKPDITQRAKDDFTQWMLERVDG
eukprot:jgi/Ulvmu1/9571/UM054_0001.1